MAKRKKKHEPIILNLIPPWKVAKGHNPHHPGAGTHLDSKQKRKRTRDARNRTSIEEQSE